MEKRLTTEELTLYGFMGNFIYDVIINIAGYDRTRIRQGGENFAPTSGNNDFTVMQLTRTRPMPTSFMSQRRQFYDDVEESWFEERMSNRNRFMQIDFYGAAAFQRGEDFVENCDQGITDSWFISNTPNIGILNVTYNDTIPMELDQKTYAERSSIIVEINVSTIKVVKLNSIDGTKLRIMTI